MPESVGLVESLRRNSEPKHPPVCRADDGSALESNHGSQSGCLSVCFCTNCVKLLSTLRTLRPVQRSLLTNAAGGFGGWLSFSRGGVPFLPGDGIFLLASGDMALRVGVPDTSRVDFCSDAFTHRCPSERIGRK